MCTKLYISKPSLATTQTVQSTTQQTWCPPTHCEPTVVSAMWPHSCWKQQINVSAAEAQTQSCPLIGWNSLFSPGGFPQLFTVLSWGKLLKRGEERALISGRLCFWKTLWIWSNVELNPEKFLSTMSCFSHNRGFGDFSHYPGRTVPESVEERSGHT